MTVDNDDNDDDEIIEHQHACGNCGILLSCDGSDCEETQRQITEACVQSDEMMMKRR